MMPMSSIPAGALAPIPEKNTRGLATGTSCLAEVNVIGRRRVPRPPDRMRPLSGISAAAYRPGVFWPIRREELPDMATVDPTQSRTEAATLSRLHALLRVAGVVRS